MKIMKPDFLRITAYFGIAVCVAALNCSCLRPRARFFPEIAGWTAEPTRHYTAENLHEHINGAAELFIQNNLLKAHSRTYVRKDTYISADIYVLETADDAITVFSSAKNERSVTDTSIGEEAIVSQFQVIFRQCNCYVDVQTGAMTAEAGAMVRALAEEISSNINFLVNNSARVCVEE